MAFNSGFKGLTVYQATKMSAEQRRIGFGSRQGQSCFSSLHNTYRPCFLSSNYRRFSPRGKESGNCSWAFTSIYYRGQECVELFHHPYYFMAKSLIKYGQKFNVLLLYVPINGVLYFVTHTHTHTHTHTYIYIYMFWSQSLILNGLRAVCEFQLVVRINSDNFP